MLARCVQQKTVSTVMTYLTHLSSGLGAKSAAGAAFNSRGRKAVDSRPEDEIEARRAGIPLHGDRGLLPHLRRSTILVSTDHGLTAVAI